LKTFVEIKRHLNKPDETYACSLVALEPGHLILRYVSDRQGRVGPILFAAGSITLAHYWVGRGFVGWRMLGPDGALRGHLFHLCRDVRIAPGTVEYLDLLLDIWVDPVGNATVLDQAEVEEGIDLGHLLESDHAWIRAWKRRILRHRERIIVEMV
jgi:hypothetical protein